MKKHFIFTLLLLSCITIKAQYIEDTATDTNLYEVIAKWDTIIPQDAERDGEREQYERWRNFWLPRLSQDGNFQTATDAYSSYADYVESLKTTSSRSSLSTLSVTADWQPMGPFTPVLNGGNQGVGQVSCIEFHPNDPHTIFAGTLGGGLWKTTDDGLNWNNLNTDFQLATLSVRAFAISKSNPNILFLSSATPLGSAFFAGIYRSIDGGNTWQLMNNGLTIGNSVGANCQSILIDPGDPDIVYLATSGGIYKSTDATSSCTWDLKNSGLDFRKIIFGMNSSTLYASGLDVIASTDAGDNWTSTGILSDANLLGKTISTINIGAEINTSIYLYATVNLDTKVHPCSLDCKRRIYFFDGSTWTHKSTMGIDSDNRSPIAVSPVSPDAQVFTGAVGFYESKNGGTSFPYSRNHCHNDIHDIKYQPGNPSKVYLATDGGVCRYDNMAINNFAFYFTDGMAIGTSYNIAGFTTSGARTFVLSGQQDCGTILYDTDLPGTQKWWYCSGGDGFENSIDYADPLTMYTTSYGVGNNGNGALAKSTNAKNFNYLFPSGNPETSIFGAPLAIDPADPKTLYQGRIDVWKTTDGWGTRNSISNFNADFSVDQSQAGTALAVAPSDEKYIYYAVCGYPPSVPPAREVRMFRTTIGGGAGNWAEITPPTPSANYTTITGIAISDKDPKHVWMCYSGYDKDLRVKESTDGGSNWTDFNDGLPTFGSPLKSFPSNHIVYQKGSDDALYLATDIGVFYRDATMSQWEPFQDNLPNVVCTWLDIDYTANKIRVGTYGRSVWESSIACFNPDADLYVKDTPLDGGNEPNPDNGYMWISDDIWVRNTNDGLTNQTHQNPIGSQVNYMYVRIRNRGCDNSLGTEKLRVYWIKASTAGNWDKFWVNYSAVCGGPTIPFGDEIPTGGGITIPAIAPGNETILEIPWTPEDPSNYNPCVTNNVHFCLLARIETSSSYPFGMTTFPENPPNASINTNVRNNNNIAWKNVIVIDLTPATPTPNIAHTIVRNVYDSLLLSKFTFSVPESEAGNSFLNYGTVKISLGDSLFQRWVDGGSIGSDMEICDDTLIHLLSPNAWIGNIPLDTGEMFVVETIFDQYVIPFNRQLLNFDIAQYDSLIGDTTILTGGVRFAINTFSTDQLLLPDSLHNNPTVSVCCGDTLLFKFPDFIMTKLSARFTHWSGEENLLDTFAMILTDNPIESLYAKADTIIYDCETGTYLNVKVECSLNPTFIRVITCGNITGDYLEIKAFSSWMSDSLVLLLSDTCYNGDSLNCEESRTAQLLEKSKGTGNIEVFPNPTTGLITIKFNNEGDESYHLNVTDLTGRILISENVKGHKGDNFHEVDLSRFNRGIYFISFRSNSSNKMVRVTRE